MAYPSTPYALFQLPCVVESVFRKLAVESGVLAAALCVRLTADVPLLLLSATLVAVTITFCDAVIEAGA